MIKKRYFKSKSNGRLTTGSPSKWADKRMLEGEPVVSRPLPVFEKSQNYDWIDECSRRLMIGFHMPDIDQMPEDSGMPGNTTSTQSLLTKFNPSKFVRALSAAHVQAFWFYNKCHRGNCYYPSRVPGAHMHSALQGRDLFSEICTACTKADIVPLCIYEFFDYRVINDHPDWCCRLADTRQSTEFMGEEHTQSANNHKVGRPCINGPYADFAIAQAVETVKNYPVHAYYVDFLGALHLDNWICPHCNAVFRDKFGFDFNGVRNLDHTQYIQYVQWHYNRYDTLARKFRRALQAVRPDIAFVHNAHAIGHIPNLQSWDMIARNTDFLTGDLFAMSGTLQTSWLPRAYRAVSRRRPEVLLDTTHGSDRWNPKALDGYLAETWTARAAGAAVCSSICPRPDGSWNPACMALVRHIFANQAACEPWLCDMEPLHEIALIHSQPSADFIKRDHKPFADMALHDLAFEGWAQVLVQSHALWDVIHDFQIKPEYLRRFKTMILPELACLSDQAVAILRDFVRRGGNLIFTGNTATCDENGRLRASPALDKAADIKRHAGGEHKSRDIVLTHHALKPRNDWEANALKYTLPPVLATTGKSSAAWAQLYNPFNGTATAHAACASRKMGRGRIIYWAGDPGLEYRTRGIDAWHRVMRAIISKITPINTPVKVNAPATVEVFAHYQTAENRLVVSLINSMPGISRSTTLLHTIHSQPGTNADVYRKIEEVGAMPPVADVSVSFQTTALKQGIRRIYRAPDGKRLRPKTQNIEKNKCTVKIPSFNVHTMIVAE